MPEDDEVFDMLADVGDVFYRRSGGSVGYHIDLGKRARTLGIREVVEAVGVVSPSLSVLSRDTTDSEAMF